MREKKILLIIPNSKIREKIEGAFLKQYFDVVCSDIHKAINVLKKEFFQVVVIDYNINKNHKKTIVELIKNDYKTALIFLHKKDQAEEIITALENGADNCFFLDRKIDELIAKVNALIRRIDLVDNAPRELKIRDIVINLDMHEVRKNGKLIDMTYTQFKLLYLLASRRDYIFTRDEIIKKLWGENTYTTNRTVDVFVKRLREKLGQRLIQTIHGLGYRVV